MQATAQALESELQTYKAHRAELLRRHRGEWVLIHDHNIVAVFPNEAEAINTGYIRFGVVPFLVRQIWPADVICEFVSFNTD